MKMKLTMGVLAFAIAFTSCKKDDPTVITNTVTVAAKQIETGGINQAFLLGGPFTSTVSGSGNYEYGCKFAVTQNGKALRLGCRMPLAGSYRVTLWDVATSTAIAQATVAQSANQTLTFTPITATSLVTGKDYLVSVYSTASWNQISPTAGGNFSYPLTSGSLSIKGYQWRSAPSPTPAAFPTTAETTYVAGLADLEFQAD